jgi:hypothetical protein
VVTALIATPSLTTDQTETASRGLGTNAMAGIGVRAAVAVAILAATAWFTLRTRKYRQVPAEATSSLDGLARPPVEIDTTVAEKPSMLASAQVSEADSDWRGHELGNKPRWNRPAEMITERFGRHELP